MNRATLIGLLAGFGLLAAAIFLGGNMASFIDMRALLIVAGGTIAVTLISFTFTELADAVTAAFRTMISNRVTPHIAAERLIRIAESMRKPDGLRELERQLPQFRHEPFLSKAMTMVVEGLNADELERILTSELDSLRTRRAKSASLLRRAAEIAPAMGLIGTLVGLVQMLGTLDNPSGIGPAMAVALLTTFYGAVLGNMIFAPLASKLERDSEAEATRLNLYAISAAALGRQESPRRLAMLINAMLPPAEQVHTFS